MPRARLAERLNQAQHRTLMRRMRASTPVGDPAESPYSLSHSYVLGCERDRRGVLWIVTQDGTLHRYEPETGRFIRYTLALEDPFQQGGAGASEFTTLHGDVQGRMRIARA